MSRITLRRLGLCAMGVLAALTVTGCQKQQTAVTSAWPVASMERVVPAPAEAVRWPYTGLDAPDEAAVNKRPLQVKIENSPQSRPQVGLGSADVVYETITEGGITRFNTVFHSTVPKEIGPVRSARLSDLWVVPQYDGLFFFSGASSSVNRAVAKSGIPNLSEDAGVSYPYFRSSKRSAPHNLFLDTTKAYEEARKRKYATTFTPEGLQFERRSAETTPSITEVTIPFSQANTARWVYDAKSDAYARFNNGAVHKDGGTGKQITADSVVVMWVKYTPISRDKVGSTTYDVNLGGQGRVSVFKHGQRFDGTWKADKDSPPRFFDASGAAIKLARGNTWFQVIPLDAGITMK